MQQIKQMLALQHQDLDELMSEVQRKEVTPARITRLLKMVKRNAEILERLVAVLDAMGAPDVPDTDLRLLSSRDKRLR